MAGATFEILRSRLEDGFYDDARLARSTREHARRLTSARRASLAELIYADVFSEYDARFLARELRGRAQRFTPAFQECLSAWEADESAHYRVFLTIHAELTRQAPESIDAEMAARERDVEFAPLAGLMRDEFSIACLMAYDEAATVRAYRASRAEYAQLGPDVVRCVDEVTADEGRHVRNFLKLIRTEHASRLGEVDAVVDRIRAHEHIGAGYTNTFVLDHDDGVWSEGIFDDAASLVRRRLRA